MTPRINERPEPPRGVRTFTKLVPGGVGSQRNRGLTFSPKLRIDSKIRAWDRYPQLIWQRT